MVLQRIICFKLSIWLGFYWNSFCLLFLRNFCFWSWVRLRIFLLIAWRGCNLRQILVILFFLAIGLLYWGNEIRSSWCCRILLLRGVVLNWTFSIFCFYFFIVSLNRTHFIWALINRSYQFIFYLWGRWIWFILVLSNRNDYYNWNRWF